MAIVMTMGTLTAAYAEDGGYAQTSQTLSIYGEAVCVLRVLPEEIDEVSNIWTSGGNRYCGRGYGIYRKARAYRVCSVEAVTLSGGKTY